MLSKPKLTNDLRPHDDLLLADDDDEDLEAIKELS